MNLLMNKFTLRALSGVAMARAFLRYHNPRRRAVGGDQQAFYDRVWREAAEQLGGSYTQLKKGIAEIEVNGARTRVVHNVSTIDDPVTLAVLHDKPLTHRILSAEGLPVPRHATFSLGNMSPALAFLKSSDVDCVVKPAGGTGGGRGVTTGIRKRSHLARAAAIAAVYADELMIEEQIPGDNYRLLYLDGELIDAYIRKLPSVIADGKSSIGKLVDLENAQRQEMRSRRSQVTLTVDLDMKRTLEKQGFSLRSVPAKGTHVTLKTVVNENNGSDNRTCMDGLCKSIIEDGARAVRALRVRFAGVDVVTRDASIPLRESGGAILEVNGTPNLYFHYNKHDGCFPVAPILLRKILCEEPQAVFKELENA